MCAYCNMGDHFFRYDPPFYPNPWPPQIPQPLNPIPQQPWDLQRLVDLQDLMRRVKALEDALGCPCEPNKADYLTLIADRIAELEKKVAEKRT